jgi:hypothetical protein
MPEPQTDAMKTFALTGGLARLAGPPCACASATTASMCSPPGPGTRCGAGRGMGRPGRPRRRWPRSARSRPKGCAAMSSGPGRRRGAPAAGWRRHAAHVEARCAALLPAYASLCETQGVTSTAKTGSQTPMASDVEISSSPNGIRTRAATLRGWCPRPLDDGASSGGSIYQRPERRPTAGQGALRPAPRSCASPAGKLGGEDSNP